MPWSNNSKEYQEHRKGVGKDSRIIRVNDDMNNVFSIGLLDRITELYNDGMDPEKIGDVFDRDPDEIFMALFHQARRERTKRVFAYRQK